MSAVLCVLLLCAASVAAQTDPVDPQPPAAPAEPAAPPAVIPVSGVLYDSGGQPRTGSVTLHLSLYASREETTPLWIEDQAVTLGAGGAYGVYFGSTRTDGLPSWLFADNSARWIGVAVAGEPEQPRTLVLSTPYASKAVNADALGGKRATDFVLSENLRGILQSWGVLGSDTGGESLLVSGASSGETQTMSFGGGSSTPNALVKWLDNQQTPGDSAAHETGGNLGIGTSAPRVRFETAGSSGSTALRVAYAAGNGNYLDVNFNTINSVGGNNLKLYDGGTGIDVQAGKVGIGTTAPRVKFEAAGAGTAAAVRVAFAAGNDNYLDLSYNTVQAVGGNNLKLYDGLAGIDVRAGDVGIGTATPEAKLHVVGGVRANGAVTADGNLVAGGALSVTGTTTLGGATSVTGNVSVTGDVTAGTLNAKYQDVAEWVEAAEPLPAATVVSAHPTRVNHVRRSTKAYDTAVLGVVSAQPGLLLGEAGDGKVAVAQSGRVTVKVDARYGAIRPGDLLVASPRAGYAMRSRPTKSGIHRPGTIIGKALEALPRGTGEILVLLTLQ